MIQPQGANPGSVDAIPADPTTAERTTSYGYDILGRLVTVTEDATPADTTDTPLTETDYGFDLQGRMSRMQTDTEQNASILTTMQYDSLGRLDVMNEYIADANPPLNAGLGILTASYDYDVRADGKRTRLEETFWFDANEDGQQTADELQVNTYDWTYDAANRLTDELFTNVDGILDSVANSNSGDQADDGLVHDYHTHFEYDLTGNRVSRTTITDDDGIAGFDAATDTDEVTSYTYDANDRLLEETKTTDATSTESTTYGYDHTQQTSKTVTSQPQSDSSGSISVSNQLFTYDVQGRQSSVTNEAFEEGTLTSRTRTNYEYDSTGYRIELTNFADANLDGSFTLETRVEFLSSRSNFTGYAQTLRETTHDADGNVSKTIDYTFGHDEIAQTVREYAADGSVTSEATHIFGHDGHGSVRVLYELAGTIAQVFTFAAYGSMLAVHNGQGVLAGRSEASALTSLGYSGEAFDAASQQQYLRARFYNTANGRFNRLDPFAGNNTDPQSFHKYLYTHGDPVNGIDPTGMMLLGGLLSGMSISTNMQSEDAAASKTSEQGARKTAKEVWEEVLDTFSMTEPTDPWNKKIAAAAEKLWVKRLSILGWIPVPLQSTPVGSHGPDMVAVKLDPQSQKVKVLIGEVKGISSSRVLSSLDRRTDDALQMSMLWLSTYLDQAVAGIVRGLEVALDAALASSNLGGAMNYVHTALQSGDIDLYLLRARHYGNGDFKLRGYRLLNISSPKGNHGQRALWVTCGNCVDLRSGVFLVMIGEARTASSNHQPNTGQRNVRTASRC